MNKLLPMFAWYGVIAILLAYFLNMFGYLGVSSLAYLLLNLTGSFAVAIDSFKDKDYRPAVLNLVWFVIALVGIARSLGF